MSAINLHVVDEKPVEADRVNPGIVHQDVLDRRDAIRSRLTTINATHMRNADERAVLLKRLDALNASDALIEAERAELVAMDRGLAAFATELDCLISERAGQ